MTVNVVDIPAGEATENSEPVEAPQEPVEASEASETTQGTPEASEAPQEPVEAPQEPVEASEASDLADEVKALRAELDALRGERLRSEVLKEHDLPEECGILLNGTRDKQVEQAKVLQGLLSRAPQSTPSVPVDPAAVSDSAGDEWETRLKQIQAFLGLN